MGNRLLVALAFVAGCKAERAPVGAGSAVASAAIHVATTPLPAVPAGTPLAAASEPVPAHEILIDEAGRIAAFASEKQWSRVPRDVTTEDPLDIDGLGELARVVHRQLQKAHDDKKHAVEEAEVAQRVAQGEKEDEVREEMKRNWFDRSDEKLGPYLFTDRPDSKIAAAGDGHPVRDAVPARVPKMTANAADPYASEPFLFVVAGKTRAHVLVDALLATAGGMIAVAAPQGVRALRWHFKNIDPERTHLADTPWAPWIELRIGAGRIEVEAVPATPVVLAGKLDPASVVAAIAKLRGESPALAADHTVDVLVDDAADVQQLVEVLAALDALEVSEVGLGRAPSPVDGDAMRGKPLALVPIPPVELDPGEGGTVPVHDLIAQHMDAIRACYANAPSSSPIVIHAKKRGTSAVVHATLESQKTPLATCIFAQLERPFGEQDVAFTVRFARYP